MAFVIAAVLLVAFVANVSIGAVTGTPILGNVTEMVLLFTASIAFVAGILKREAAAKRTKKDSNQV